MSKIANYLGGHLRGEVVTSLSIRQNFSEDGSIIKIPPALVIYPFNTSDVRKIAHFAWQLAEKGHVLSLTPRGGGSSRVGAAIGPGGIVSFPTHMNAILEVDTTQKLVRLQPGASLFALQEALKLHGFIWPVEASSGIATVGGAIANNLYGERGLSYGAANEWVDQLEVVLANGDIIQTGKLSKRELSKKKGVSGLEGEIYRQLDGLITDNPEVIKSLAEKPGSTGYALGKVKDKKGNFDLTPLLAGSQGSLGIITEAILRLDVHHPHTEVVAASLVSVDGIEDVIQKLIALEPTRLEFVDSDSLQYAQEQHGVTIKELLPSNEEAKSANSGLIIVECKDIGRRAKAKAKKAMKLLDKAGHFVVRSEGDTEAASEILQIYHRIEATLTNSETEHKQAVPIIEDAMVSPSEVVYFAQAVQELATKHRIKIVLSAHVGTGIVHARPLLNLRNLSDKQKIPKLISDYYALVLRHDGSIAGEYGEGRLRVEVANHQFTSDEKKLLLEVKKIFDVYGIFNPGVKISGDKEPAIKLSDTFNPGRSTDYLPRI